MICLVSGCAKEIKARGLCAMHWARVKRYNSLDGRKKEAARFPLSDYPYKIEANIPCPPPIGGKGPKRAPARFPFAYLTSGDSFFIPLEDYGERGWMPINTSINNFQQKNDVRLCWRKRTREMHGEEGWRIWRVK